MIKKIIDRWLMLNADPDEKAVNALRHDLKNNSIQELEIIIEEKKKEVRKIETDNLYNYMDENELDIFENEQVKGKIKMYVSVSQKDKTKLFNWLTDNGYKDIIKENLKFSKGDADEKLIRFLNENGYAYERDGTVAPQSLKKLVSSIIEHNQTIENDEQLKQLPDEDMCKINYFNCVEIKKK